MAGSTIPAEDAVDLQGLTFRQKTQLVQDLRSTYTIWSRDHGLREAMFIATGGRERFKNVEAAMAEAVEAIGADAGVRRVIDYAIAKVEAS